MLLSSVYNKLSIDRLQILFPGKTKETLLNLIEKLEKRNIDEKSKENHLNKKIKLICSSKDYRLGKHSFSKFYNLSYSCI